MNGLLFLLFCIEILGALRCGANNSSAVTITNQSQSEITVTSMSTASTQSAKTLFKSSKVPSTTPSPQPSILDIMLYEKVCLPVVMVTGGLMTACTILLLSTLWLALKVCHLSRRIKVLHNNDDLTSNPEHSTGTAKKDKSKSETEPNETSVLMADLRQEKEEMGNDTTKEDGAKVNEDGQMREETKEAVGDAASSEEASTTPATADENSSSLKPQEEATESQPTKAASASEDTEEPKGVV